MPKKKIILKKFHNETVEHNLWLCGQIIQRAEIINAGMYTHEIRSTLEKMKPMLKKLKKTSPKKVSMEELGELGKLRIRLSSTLYLRSQGLEFKEEPK